MTNEQTPSGETAPPAFDARWIDHRVMHLIDRVTEWAEDGAAEITGLPTGFRDYDRLTCGLQPGQLTLVGGPSGSGKTSFALNVAESVGVTHGLPVVIFSFRTSGEDVTQRLTAALGRIDAHHLRTGALRDTEWSSLTKAVDRLSRCSILIDDDVSHTVASMRAVTVKLAQEISPMRIGLVVVDGLGWIEGSEKMESIDRWARMDQIARDLKALARDLGSHIMLTCDLKKHATDYPWVGDLYGPATLPSIADVVALLYRPEQFGREPRGVAYIVIAKQDGPVGTVQVTWSKYIMRFDDPEVLEAVRRAAEAESVATGEATDAPVSEGD